MKYFFKLLIISLFITNSWHLFAQINSTDEYQIRFPNINYSDIKILTNFVSIDNYNLQTKELSAYVNNKQLKKLSLLAYSFQIQKAQKKEGIIMATSLQALDDWNAYPTYNQYIQKMHQLADSFPSICRLDTIGFSVQNRLLLALKISDNVNTDEEEPEFFYTSTMHGDEITGYVLLLRFADYLLNNYDSSTLVKSLVDSMEIFINPLANPDGTYRTGNNDISGAIRSNANLVDPNRNFPNPLKGEHPDGESWQPETKAMMAFFDKHHIVMSANFHGGTEVLNYPWDTYSKRHPDDKWYQYVSHIYADTAHAHSTSYMTGFDSGITDGYDWYVAYGTRQDYANYYAHCREVTIELSYTKMLPASSLPEYWEYNYRSLLYYMQQAQWGLRGRLIDKNTRQGIKGQIYLIDHDADNSFVVSDEKGYFFRPASSGSYTAVAVADGYKSDTIENISLLKNQITNIEFRLEQGDTGIENYVNSIHSYPNPFTNNLKVKIPYKNIVKIEILNLNGKIVFEKNLHKENYVLINTRKLVSGLYFLRLKTSKRILRTKIIKI